MAAPVWSLADIDDSLLTSAWEHVRDNEGCPGVDGVSVAAYSHQVSAGIPELRTQLHQGAYYPLPLRKLVVEKKPGSQSYRTLLVPVVRDRVAQTALARLLAREWEQEFLTASYAYRPGRGVDLAVQRIVELRDGGWTWVVDADITSYFDSISHALLDRLLRERSVPPDALALLRQWIQPDFWDGHELHTVKRGIAQGSPVSPLLANLFLTPFDTELEEIDARLVRYADDFVLLCRSEDAARDALARAARWLSAAGLTLHPEKTRITNFEEGFRYLGVVFRGKEAMVPWKSKQRVGHVVFLAKPMPRHRLTEYRKAHELLKPVRTAALPASPRPRSSQPEHFPTEIDMAFLYITEPGACLRKAGERFLVECDQHVLLDRPMHRLEHILLFGNVQVSSQAVAEALDGGVGVSFFTRNGRYRGTLTPGRDHSVDLRIAQYRLYADPARSLEWAKATVARKVSNGLAVVERYEARAREDAAADGMEAAVTAALKTLETAQTVAEVDGAEGSAAHAYFDALFGRFNRSSLAWPGRVKHPATDPLNALLSLGYTLLMNELLGLAEARGLDPALGFLHQLDGNRPALALDLMEPFRHPVVDRMVLTAVNRQMFSAEDFTSHGEDTGVVLTPEKFRRFLEEYERCMLAPVAPPPDGAASKATTIRRLLQQELLNFARALRGEIPWEPCAFPWKGEQEKACPTS